MLKLRCGRDVQEEISSLKLKIKIWTDNLDFLLNCLGREHSGGEKNTKGIINHLKDIWGNGDYRPTGTRTAPRAE